MRFDPPSSTSEQDPAATTAELRSQAVAKLKRAASLPRHADGRRPAQLGPDNEDNAGPSFNYGGQFADASISASQHLTSDHHEGEEILSPSPVMASFENTNIYGGTGLKRSASASSSFHIPTPPHLVYGQQMGGAYNLSSVPPSPDWAAMQLAHSYLPSISPVPLASGHVSGRNTPSPLPSLGALRNIQRSNSAAARARAMEKLTGGRDTPSEEDQVLQLSSVRPNLQRADTLGPVMLGLALSRPVDVVTTAQSPVQESSETRPRLQRSFTVSSTNMGEERRSAVGRRMVERLAERKAARQKEEDQVRRLWEEKRAAVDQGQHPDVEHGADEDEEDVGRTSEDLPVVERTSPPDSPAHTAGGDMLAVPDRPISRMTTGSNTSPFEYEAHLRRSLSSRTARGAVGTVAEVAPNVSVPQTHPEEGYEQLHDFGLGQPISHAPFITPTKPGQPSSSQQATSQSGYSPGSASIQSGDGLNSMMFVMGQGSASGVPITGDTSWPVTVSDVSGSNWGTPLKDMHQPTFLDPPLERSPLASSHRSRTFSHDSDDDDGSLTPPGVSERTSVMSWVSVGGPEDQEVPSDPRYHKKSGSMSAKIGNLRSALRKRRESRGSATSSITSPPTSPKILSIAGFSRRGSESSTSPSHTSVARSFARGFGSGQGEHVKHQASISSLAPSVPEASANSMLLQHQLSADPNQVSLLPRADPSDPRIHSSKLSPFPGIAQLEQRKQDGDMPKLIHQASDSVVPSQRAVTGSGDPTSSLGLPQTAADRRASVDSVGKRTWLAKAFGQQSSPRSSASNSRKNSVAEISDIVRTGRKPSVDGLASFGNPYTEADPFAAPPPPLVNKPRHRSVSPSVSIVHEVSEEGSRLTRFTNGTHRFGNDSPLVEEDEQANDAHVHGEMNGYDKTDTAHQEILPQKSMDVLNRMDDLLALAPDDPARPDILDDPPRKLILATQTLQVVNVNTAKDRFLFLFNDLLVIAKPLISSGMVANLDMKFMVKSIVPLDKLTVSGLDTPETGIEPPRHPVVNNFIDQFAADPVAACRYLTERSNPKVDAPTLASLIFKTAELDKDKIGTLLAGNDKLLRAFLERFHFTGVRIDDALRMFLLSLRLPTESQPAVILLKGFARRYVESNTGEITFDVDMAADLVMSIMQLNDILHDMYGYAHPNPQITESSFIRSFQSRDPEHTVPTELLGEIFRSLQAGCLDQALSAEEKDQERDVVVGPTRLPTKLTYNIWSEEIQISIPEPDPALKIRLWGEGLEFDPPVLHFAESKTRHFRVKGAVLGTKSMIFERTGANAALYGSIGNIRTFAVERAFMRHTLHVAFVSPTGLKRKYCFSVLDSETRQKWGQLLTRQISTMQTLTSRPIINAQQRIRQAAQAVSLQVLRDALIPPEEKSEPVEKKERDRLVRAGSVSVTYDQQMGKQEGDLGPLQPSKVVGGSTKQSGLLEVQSGKELVLLCRQNSLLPGLLELLQTGVGDGNGNRNGQGNGDQAADEYQHQVIPVSVGRMAGMRGGRV